MNLERLFAYGPRAAVSAQDVFTNRLTELSAFEEALQQTKFRHGDHSLIENLAAGRRNVLVFHGMGGSGKSTLSLELQRRFDAGDYPEPAQRRASFRLDFGDRASSDLEALLLRIRACVGQLNSRWPAFDLALLAYWERKYPGTPIQQFLDRESSIRAAAGKIDLSQQLQDAVDVLLGGGGLAGTAFRTGKLLKNAVLERLDRHRLLEDCSFFKPLIEAVSLEEIRYFLPVLLAWDLATHQKQKGADFAVFFDTFENVQAYPEELCGVEDVLGRMVYLMPNVLFVITGRSRVGWDNGLRKTSLKYAGPQRWPGLAQDDQYLLDGLSRPDCEQYLKERLLVDGGPAIPAEIRQRIIDGSGGLPLYLDLSADYYEEMTVSGVPSASNFGGPLPELVQRVVRDLTSEERQLLRCATLVRAFDPELLKIVVAGTRDATIDKFLNRHFVRHQPENWLPYSLHDTLCESVRNYDGILADAWSEAEWASAADAIVAFFENEASMSVERTAGVERSRLVHAFVQCAGLANEFGKSYDWLVKAAERLSKSLQWETLSYPSSLSPLPHSPSQTLALACSGLLERVQGSYANAISLFSSALQLPKHSEYVEGWLRLQYGEALLRQSEFGAAEEQLRLLVASDAFAEAARSLLAVSDMQHGRFVTLRSWATEKEDSRLDLLAWAYNRNGMLEASAQTFGREAELAEKEGVPEPIAVARTHRLCSLCFARPWQARKDASGVIELTEDLGRRINTAQAWAALAIAKAGFVDKEEVSGHIARSRDLLAACGAKGADWMHPYLAEVFLECVLGDVGAALRARGKVEEVVHHYGTEGVLLPVTAAWLSHIGADCSNVSSIDVGVIEWLDDEESALGRWIDVLAKRRREVASLR